MTPFYWNLIFQFVNCLRNRRNIYLDETISKQDNQIASLLCGSAFYLYPDQSIFSHTAITIVEIYWTLYCEQIKSYLKWIPLDKIKMIYIVFPIVFGYVCHVRVFYPWLAPSILKKLMHLTTNYKYDLLNHIKSINLIEFPFVFVFVIYFRDRSIVTKYHKLLFGLNPQFIL